MKGRNKGSRRRQNVKKQDKMQADTTPFSRMEEERLRRRGKVRAEPLRSELARQSFLSWKFYPPKLTHASIQDIATLRIYFSVRPVFMPKTSRCPISCAERKELPCA